MTRAEQHTVVPPTSGALAADSRERAVRALLRFPPLRRLWSAQLVGGVGDALALLVLVLLAQQAAAAQHTFGGGYRGAAFAVAAVFGARLLATFLFGAVLLGPLSALTAAGPKRKGDRDGRGSGNGRRRKSANGRRNASRDRGPLDRRWTMIGADAVRLALLVIAPLWIDWTPQNALALVLVTVFVAGVAERFWTVAREAAAPALLPAPPPEGAAVRPLPDHLDALHRLSLRTGFVTLPIAAAGLVVVTLIGNGLGAGIAWFHLHQAALASYVASGLFAASVSILWYLELPDARAPRARSPLEGLRRPKADGAPDKGRTGAIPLLVLVCAAVAGAIAASVAVAALHVADLGGGPVGFGLFVLALTGGTVAGIRLARRVLPALSRRRLLALATAVTGIALLAAGLVPDPTTVMLLGLLAGVAAGIAAGTGHTLLDQEAEEARQARITDHLHAVVRVFLALGAVAAPLLAAAIGPHRLAGGDFVFAHGGAAFTLMLAGALLLPVAALVLVKTDDRSGVPLRRDLLDALRGGEPAQAPAANGFFIAVEGGDGAGKSTQVEALAEWIRAKGHEVVVTREPGATAMGKRLRSILLDVSSAGISHRAEALLYAADRAEHIDTVVRPALERGAVVISDRYIDSSVAYQGAGRDLSPAEIARISRWATEGLVPHLTVLLDIAPETARERFTEAPDRLESEPPEFHARVRAGFLTLAAADPARYLVVDAGQEPEAVTTVVRHRLDQMLPLSEAEIRAREEARKAAEEERKRREAEEAARKAEEERQERERQEQLARLRAEEAERKARAEEEARRLEAERQAEEARLRAEEARRLAEEERLRREAEERARAEEQERLRRRAAEEKRLRAEAEARRVEKQRRAEEALLRAEQARLAAEAATATPHQGTDPDAEATVETPVVEQDAGEGERAGGERGAGRPGGDERGAGGPGAAEEGSGDGGRGGPPDGGRGDARGNGRDDRRGSEAGDDGGQPGHGGAQPGGGASGSPGASHGGGTGPSGAAATGGSGRVGPDDETQTIPTPRADARGTGQGTGSGGAAGDTAVLPPVRPEAGDADGRGDAAGPGRTRGSGGPEGREGRDDGPDAEETAVLPQPPVPGAADETAVLPPVRPEGPAGGQPRPPRGEQPEERVPPWLFRPEAEGGRESASPREAERTREMPRIDPSAEERPRRTRPDWAEDTPLDDLPSLADELLGPHDEEDDDDRRHGRRA